MEPSSRTPEGQSNFCPVCRHEIKIEPSRPTGDAPCPHCGHLLWFQEGLHVKEAIAAYFEAVERWEAPNVGKFLADHADVAKELKQFFADYALFRDGISAGSKNNP